MDDLIVIGAGWAGLTATAFALEMKENIRLRLIAQGIGSVIITPGWISVLDSAQGGLKEAIGELIQRVPDHPYALAGSQSLFDALISFSQISERALGLRYVSGGNPPENQTVLAALGTTQRPALTPSGYDHSGAFADTALFVGFEGWRDYYPALSGPRTAVVTLPKTDRHWDAAPTDLAREFDKPDFRAAVANRVKPVLNGAQAVGFPAVLGLEEPETAREDLHKRLGVAVFEIPTLPPSVPGTRLYNKMRRYFLDHGVRMQIGHPVARGLVENGRVTGVEVAAAGKPQRFYADRVILATGGLYGGGLFSDDRGRIWEPIFGLPVVYDPDRTRWFNPNLLDPRGHPVHYFGVRANNRMQPVDQDGNPIVEGLYVAGHILAHPNMDGAPRPFETAEGVALATAYRAVTCALGSG
jgi:glycerol-3-phosphate dehydrogenase subunit B